MNHFFKDEQILKCAFYAPQLLNRGLLKELTRLKNEKYQDEIKELAFLRRLSLDFKEEKRNTKRIDFKFPDSKIAWEIYLKLRSIFSLVAPVKIETRLKMLFSASSFTQWKGAKLLKEKCGSLFPKRSLTEKSLESFELKVFRAWRATIRYFRIE
ncbi:MAG: hypothetical protein ACTSRI_20290 [Promethearchaeota archaeon]